ncbi:MAG: hypothetical protein JKY99_02085 [Rhizobiales bacterium]|nr:hypothetical protein [Hyphomicrobiales bacterium]
MASRKQSKPDSIDIQISTFAAVLIIGFLSAVAFWFGTILLSTPTVVKLGGEIPMKFQVLQYVLAVLVMLVLLTPVYVLGKALKTGQPLIRFDDQGVQAIKWPIMRNQIKWTEVDGLKGKGIWIILIDKNKRQHRTIEGMMGTKGLWLPSVLAKGGSVAIGEAINTYRPEVISPVF